MKRKQRSQLLAIVQAKTRRAQDQVANACLKELVDYANTQQANEQTKAVAQSMRWEVDLDMGFRGSTTVEADGLDQAWLAAAKWAQERVSTEPEAAALLRVWATGVDRDQARTLRRAGWIRVM